MSLQKTLAAAAAAAAAHDWRQHLASCAQCARSRHRGRRAAARCVDGAMLHAALQAAQNQLDYERKQEGQPAPGQAALDLGLPGQLELPL